MAEYTQECHQNVESAEKREVAHGWVSNMADRMLAFAGQDEYAEFQLGTDTQNATEMLRVMTVSDLLLRPGAWIGRPIYTEYDDDDSVNDKKMALWHGTAFIVPRRADAIFLAAASRRVEAAEKRLRYLAVGFEYGTGKIRYRQLVGVAAHPELHVDAMRIAYGEADGDSILKTGYSRPISFVDTREFVDCAGELFALLRQPQE